MLGHESFARIEQLADQVCSRENCRVYDIEFVGDGRGKVLRVFVDRSQRDENGLGVSIDDCSNISKGLSLLLDAEDRELIPGGAYHLEISSPGLDRVLRKKWHFETVVGQTVKLKLNAALAAVVEEPSEEQSVQWARRQQIVSELKEVTDRGVLVTVDKEKVFIPFEAIEKANAVIDFGASMPKMKDKGRKAKGKKRR